MTLRNKETVSIPCSDIPVRMREPSWNQTKDIVDSGFITTFAAGSTAHTKGSWQEIFAATSVTRECSFIDMEFYSWSTSTSSSAVLVDLGIGPSGSEYVIASNIAISSWTTSDTALNFPTFRLPIRLPRNTRIAVRFQSSIASRAGSGYFNIGIDGNVGLVPGFVDVLGTSTSTSRGTNIGSQNTWTQIISSTARPYTNLIAIPSLATNAASATTGTFELGIGAAGSEVSEYGYSYTTTSGEAIWFYNNAVPLLRDSSAKTMVNSIAVPTGSRLACRRSGSQAIDACIIGVGYP